MVPANTTGTILSKRQLSRLADLEIVRKAIAAGIEQYLEKSRRKLFDIPQDIIKVILGLAYANDQQTVTVSEKGGRAATKVEDFLVSKAYFVVAAPAYVGDRVFQIQDRSLFQGIINAYATRIIITDALSLEHWMKGAFANVRRMEMQLSDCCLQGWYTIEWRQEQTKRQTELSWLSKKGREVLGGLESLSVTLSRIKAALGPSPHRARTIDICRKNAESRCNVRLFSATTLVETNQSDRPSTLARESFSSHKLKEHRPAGLLVGCWALYHEDERMQGACISHLKPRLQSAFSARVLLQDPQMIEIPLLPDQRASHYLHSDHSVT
ncbi:uncharacterized protein MYCFIDRAFT_177394 [Pseudocercospora fijiensis CIRAD86]|uniref:Uncharacterized protein n=1 Tax=Pseudocercospora fijiensis (strain CIRAD86) TaxID=383855 RepID=M2YRU4_PSEFD|nr:uncharacterized protein MYCFIDRAFT_177394 [Pseudocercospora fijiensis CIRAD86]EME80455.1 hypothetical protein MYCFIDRAFT_177394 [Pseudocercospora fijiensis CIRAD86]